MLKQIETKKVEKLELQLSIYKKAVQDLLDVLFHESEEIKSLVRDTYEHLK